MTVVDHTAISLRPVRKDTSPILIEHWGEVDYLTAYERQHEYAAQRAAGDRPDTLVFVTHPSIFTAGKRTQPEDLPTDGSPVVSVDRGGRITWHGPGQLVGYPIVALAEPLDVVEYVRRIESVILETCAELGLSTQRVEGRSGVWVVDPPSPTPTRRAAPTTTPPVLTTEMVARLTAPRERKVGAIGIRVAQGVAMHGFAINCDNDLSIYDRIVPCGIADAGVTSLSAELGRPVSVADVTPIVTRALTSIL